MSFSRRKFIKTGVLAAACAGLPLKSVFGQSETTASGAGLSGAKSLESLASFQQLEYYSKAAFTPYINTGFRVYLSATKTRSLLLTQVGDYLKPLTQADPAAISPGMECFSLFFTGSPAKQFTQDTYLVEHDALGTFYLFIVPVNGHSAKGPDYYEAIIYRRPGADSARSQEMTSAGKPDPTTTAVTLQSAQGPWRVADAKGGEREIYNFSSLMPAPANDQEKPKPAPVEATWLTMAQDRGVNGIKLGMSAEQVLALFPGSRDDEEIRASISANNLGLASLVIKPQNYSSKSDFEGINQIILTLLDGRVSTLYVGYDAPVAENLDEAVAKFSKGRKLPPADSWAAYSGLDDQLKTMKCKDYEISVFAGGRNVNVNYVQMVDTTAQQKLKERRARLKKTRR